MLQKSRKKEEPKKEGGVFIFYGFEVKIISSIPFFLKLFFFLLQKSRKKEEPKKEGGVFIFYGSEFSLKQLFNKS